MTRVNATGAVSGFLYGNVRQCSGCAEVKPVTAFHKRVDGSPMRKCKDCYNAKCRDYRKQNRAAVAARDRIRSTNPERLKQIAAYSVVKRRQHNAKSLVAYHIKAGNLIPEPCFLCGEKAEAHHPDYDQPLDVVWLCRPHHMQAHALAKKPAQTVIRIGMTQD